MNDLIKALKPFALALDKVHGKNPSEVTLADCGLSPTHFVNAARSLEDRPMLSDDGKEEIALGLIFVKDFKCGGKFDSDSYSWILRSV
tara:strand:+ start:86 stop:349 length:264 start_codon:yes stop_codon:yes gene_type:complete